MSRPSVSVIVGTYNCAKFLPDFFACLDAQTFRDFEVIAVDDASTDAETLRILESRGDSIRLIRRETNSATCELPRYQGVKAARAELCAFLDADDRWDPTFLERTVDVMQTQPGAALVHTYVRVVDAEDRVQRIRHENAMPEGADVVHELLRHCFITISSVVVRREIWLSALPENEINDFGMDLDFFLSIAKKYPIIFLPETLASYRRSDASVSVKKWKRAPRNVVTSERLLKKGQWRGVVSRKEMRRILLDAYCEDAEYWRSTGAPERARWFCVHGLARFPLSPRLWTTLLKTAVRTKRT